MADRYAGQAGQQLGYIPRGAYLRTADWSIAVLVVHAVLPAAVQAGDGSPQAGERQRDCADRLFGSLSRMDTMIEGGR